MRRNRRGGLFDPGPHRGRRIRIPLREQETTMRFMVLVKASKESEAGQMPGEEILTAMGKDHEELAISHIQANAVSGTRTAKLGGDMLAESIAEELRRDVDRGARADAIPHLPD
jgi:hypothetical protein